MVAFPATASAQPGNCLVGGDRNGYPMYAHAACGNGSGQFRVIAVCDPYRGDPYTKYGNWGTPRLKMSKAFCKGEDYLKSWRFDLR
jgi:hypothetical protein